MRMRAALQSRDKQTTIPDLFWVNDPKMLLGSNDLSEMCGSAREKTLYIQHVKRAHMFIYTPGKIKATTNQKRVGSLYKGLWTSTGAMLTMSFAGSSTRGCNAPRETVVSPTPSCAWLIARLRPRTRYDLFNNFVHLSFLKIFGLFAPVEQQKPRQKDLFSCQKKRLVSREMLTQGDQERLQKAWARLDQATAKQFNCKDFKSLRPVSRYDSKDVIPHHFSGYRWRDEGYVK